MGLHTYGTMGVDWEERVRRSLNRWTGLPAVEERRFLEVIDEVEPRLVEYVRGHRDFFLTLDEAG